MTKIESGEILIKGEKDLNDLFRLVREAVKQDTLNDKNKDFLLKAIDWLETELKTTLTSSEAYEKKLDWMIDNLSSAKLKEYAKLEAKRLL